MDKNRVKIVPLQVKGAKKDISKEPELKELKRMIRTGELDPERTVDRLKENKKHEHDSANHRFLAPVVSCRFFDRQTLA